MSIVKQGEKGIVILLLYVDDSAIFGSRAGIDELMSLVKEEFTIKSEGKLNDFLGCNIIKDKDQTTCWLHQPHLIKKLEKNFGEKVKKIRKPSTPGTPGKILYKLREEDGATPLSNENQKEYRSGVGSLLYLLKHSRPELSNPIRELTKAMMKAGKEHENEMYRILKWVLTSKNKGLEIKPQFETDNNGDKIYELRAVVDATWGTDREKALSISGFIVYFMEAPISWRSKSQKHVTLSSTEAEYVALSEVVKEVMYIQQILESSFNIHVKLPILIQIDNTGAIYITENNARMGATRHINIRYHYVRELVEKGILKVDFIRTDDNDADTMTKNLAKIPLERHENKLVKEIPFEGEEE